MQVTAPGGFHSSRVHGFNYPAKIRSTAIQSDTCKNDPSSSFIFCEDLAGLALRTLMLEWYDVGIQIDTWEVSLTINGFFILFYRL